eukprot:PhF_6_TR13243/c0_g1_i1/m.20984/K10744/RNASEH2B; ribonuclease H2 subunit B
MSQSDSGSGSGSEGEEDESNLRTSILPSAEDQHLRARQCIGFTGTHHLVLLPESMSSSNSSLLKTFYLPHPGSKPYCIQYAISEGNPSIPLLELREVPLAPHVSRTSWILGDTLYRSHRTLVATPFDIKFLLIMILSSGAHGLKQDTYYSVQDIESAVDGVMIPEDVVNALGGGLCEVYRNHVHRGVREIMENLCESKASPFDPDHIHHRLHSEKVVQWLKAKIDKLMNVPAFRLARGVGATGTSVDIKKDLLPAAIGVVCEYVSVPWRDAVCRSYGVDVSETRKGKDKGVSVASHFEARKRITDEDDDLEDGGSAKKKKGRSTTAPPVAKRPKGVPDISTFFKKKYNRPT